MLSTLDDVATLRRRARLPLVLAAVLSSMSLAPLVVLLLFGRLLGERVGLRELVLFGGWSAILGAMFAAAVVGSALAESKKTQPAFVIVGSIAAGIVYPVCLFAPCALLWWPGRGLQDVLLGVVVGPILLTLVGAFFSVPSGATFGVVFWAGIAWVRGPMERPAHDVVFRARSSGAVMLFAATCVALALSGILEGNYCETLFSAVLPALGVVVPDGTDAAWTRFLVLPAPLYVGLIAFSLSAWLEHRKIARTAKAILSSTHPIWFTDGPLDLERATEGGALPLRESDRHAPTRVAVRARLHGSPYRAGGSPLAVIAAR